MGGFGRLGRLGRLGRFGRLGRLCDNNGVLTNRRLLARFALLVLRFGRVGDVNHGLNAGHGDVLGLGKVRLRGQRHAVRRYGSRGC